MLVGQINVIFIILKKIFYFVDKNLIFKSNYLNNSYVFLRNIHFYFVEICFLSI